MPLVALSVLGLVAWLARRPLPAWLFVTAPLAGLVAAGVAAAVQQFSDNDVARVIEQRNDCDGVLISALQFDDSDDDWHREVHRRAASVATLPRTVQSIPIRIDRRRLGAALGATLLIGGLSLVSPWGSIGPAAAADIAVLEAEADRLEAVADLLDEASEAAAEPDEALEALADELRQLSEEIRLAESPEDAADRLERASEELRERAGEKLLSEQTAVNGLEQQLAASPLSAGGSDAAGQFEALAEQLAGMDEKDRQELADRLDALAESQASGNSEVAASLSNAANQLRSGDAAAASASLNRAAGAQRLARVDVGRRSATASASNAAAGAAGRLRNPNGQGDGQGEGQGEGQGQGDGEGEGQGQGQGPASGGAAGQVAGASPTGGQSAGQGGVGTPGPGSPDEEGRLSDVELAEVYDPTADAADDVQVDIGGGQGEGDVVGAGDGTTRQGSSFVPFRDVLPQYLDDAATALDDLQLPPDLRATVRDYFDHLSGS